MCYWEFNLMKKNENSERKNSLFNLQTSCPICVNDRQTRGAASVVSWNNSSISYCCRLIVMYTVETQFSICNVNKSFVINIVVNAFIEGQVAFISFNCGHKFDMNSMRVNDKGHWCSWFNAYVWLND